MAIVKHIAIHKSPLRFLRYILNGEKTEDMKFAKGLNCGENVQSVYMEMCATFEQCSNERFYMKSLDGKSSETLGKEKIRMHHYIQSFKPNEVTPEEAHKIGVEWARKVFGSSHQVLVTTHCDRSHIHNHFAVAAFDLNGKAWLDDKKSLKRCRDISDEICKAHGLSVIEKPKYKANHKYSDWLARQTGVSWKQRLCDDIDKIILREDVKSVDDLAERLREKGYAVTLKKYLSIKADKKRKAVRSLRLGDGYGIEELRYRIENKNQEMSISALAQYSGIQREYAMCLRELQISLYRKPENPLDSAYSELRKNTELLCYICDNKITSVADFENTVNAAAEKSDGLKKRWDDIQKEIQLEEKIIADSGRYLELKKIKFPTIDVRKEMEGLKYLAKHNLRSSEDVESHKRELVKLTAKLSQVQESCEAAENEKRTAGQNYQTYLRQMQSEYDFILESIRREQEEILKAEQDIHRKQEREKESQNRTRNNFYR